MEWILSIFTPQVLTWIGGIAGALVGGRILKWILEKTKLAEKAGNFGFGIGRTITLGAAHWKYTKKYWNKTIEPYVILILDKFIGGIIRGLKSDNES